MGSRLIWEVGEFGCLNKCVAEEQERISSDFICFSFWIRVLSVDFFEKSVGADD